MNDLLSATITGLLTILIILAMVWVFYRGLRNDFERHEFPRHRIQLKGMEVNRLAPRIEHLRHDYISAIHQKPRAMSHQKEHLAEAARKVGHMHYFESLHTGGEDSPDLETEGQVLR